MENEVHFMESILLTIAAALAGIGTGLAGLSAATVMVPILITLCPSFAGETGAYQATAIALASDILGSAVTTATYIKYKNIDLKRGWIMFVCILVMCTVGSYAAWLAGNVVLGAFTLFLTFVIGIRFLVKPDSSGRETVSRGEKLDAKGVAVSLFFGLTIGFGTGFVGTGGGMMMLVVFTLFLSMDRRTAVGTSTFIMTFTALIAAVSHILIHPAIVTDRLGPMMLCIVVATVFSLISARFANRVNDRTVGLVTGAVLTLLGAAMILLHYRSFLAQSVLFSQTAACFARFLLVIAVCAISLLLVRAIIPIPRPIFRKLLHIIAFGTSAYLVAISASWQAAALAMVLFAAVIYPLLYVLEGSSWYAPLFIEKKPGEIKKSLLLLFLGEAAVVAIGWGLAGERAIAAAAILMWGVGDGFAALVGIYLGRHPLPRAISDGKKTWEGSAAMFLTAMACGAVTLHRMLSLPPITLLAVTLPTAALAAFTELASREGNDTVTVPLVTVTALAVLLRLLAYKPDKRGYSSDGVFYYISSYRVILAMDRHPAACLASPCARSYFLHLFMIFPLQTRAGRAT